MVRADPMIAPGQLSWIRVFSFAAKPTIVLGMRSVPTGFRAQVRDSVAETMDDIAAVSCVVIRFDLRLLLALFGGVLPTMARGILRADPDPRSMEPRLL